MRITAVEITNAECGDIAITAAEGGIGYWSQIESYDWKRWTEPNEFVGDSIEVADDFVFYTIHLLNDDESGYRPEGIDITPQVIKRGVLLVLQGVPWTDDGWASSSYPAVWNFEPRQFADMEDISAMDSAEADWVFQLGALGHLMYG